VWSYKSAKRHSKLRRLAKQLLFADAEGGEDEAEDVVGGGGSGEGVEGAEGGVEVEEDQLVGQAGGVGGVGGVECGEGCRDRLLLAEVV